MKLPVRRGSGYEPGPLRGDELVWQDLYTTQWGNPTASLKIGLKETLEETDG